MSFAIVDPRMLLAERKNYGYSADAGKKTHPIEARVESTDQADDMFDGISYAKGAEAVKQLFLSVGCKLYRRAMNRYFRMYALKSADCHDLVGCFLAEARHMEQPEKTLIIKEWLRDWIRTAGTNIVRIVSFSGDKLILEQSSVLSQHSTLRRHMLLVSTFDEAGDVTDTIPICLLPQALTEISIPDVGKSSALLLNESDLSFIRSEVDETSAQFFYKNLKNIQSEMRRLMIFKNMYDAVRGGKLKGDHLL